MENHQRGDALIVATYICIKIIRENPDLDERLIDKAVNDAFIVSTTPEQWEEATRMLLALQATERNFDA